MAEKYVISKERSFFIKGIAILFMLLHHAFTFPDWIVPGLPFHLSAVVSGYLQEPLKLCVGLFAFISGWAYALRPHTLRSTWQSIRRFLLSYWLVAIPVLAFAALFCGYVPTVKSVLLELFGLKNEVMLFCWYVAFYICSLFLLLGIRRWLDKGILPGLIVGIILPIGVFMGCEKLVSGRYPLEFFQHLKHWFPCITAGYLCSRYDLFGRLPPVRSKALRFLLAVLALFVCGVLRRRITALDFVYAPILVYSLSRPIREKCGPLTKAFVFLGRLSTNLWFLHCLFFSEFTRPLFQPLAYISPCGAVCFAMLLLELLPFAWAFTKLDQRINAAIEKNHKIKSPS